MKRFQVIDGMKRRRIFKSRFEPRLYNNNHAGEVLIWLDCVVLSPGLRPVVFGLLGFRTLRLPDQIGNADRSTIASWDSICLEEQEYDAGIDDESFRANERIQMFLSGSVKHVESR